MLECSRGYARQRTGLQRDRRESEADRARCPQPIFAPLCSLGLPQDYFPELSSALSMACGDCSSASEPRFAASDLSNSSARLGPTDPISFKASATLAASSGAIASS